MLKCSTEGKTRCGSNNVSFTKSAHLAKSRQSQDGRHLPDQSYLYIYTRPRVMTPLPPPVKDHAHNSPMSQDVQTRPPELSKMVKVPPPSRSHSLLRCVGQMVDTVQSDVWSGLKDLVLKHTLLKRNLMSALAAIL